jgi:urease accessory protein
MDGTADLTLDTADRARPAGRLDVTFGRDESGTTYLGRQFASYPYHLCRPLRFEGDPEGMATLYVQSCAGGLFEHDRLVETIHAGPGAAAHVTTQASTIVHGMTGGEARQTVTVGAEAGAYVELLPDPFILFPDARFVLDLKLRAHPTATIIAGESFLAHDPGGAGAAFDRLSGTIVIEGWDGGVLARERGGVDGRDFLAGRPGVLGRFRCLGTMVAIHRGRSADDLLSAVRDAMASLEGVYAGATSLPGEVGIVLRYLAEDGLALRRASGAAWASLRTLIVGAKPRPRPK